MGKIDNLRPFKPQLLPFFFLIWPINTKVTHLTFWPDRDKVFTPEYIAWYQYMQDVLSSQWGAASQGLGGRPYEKRRQQFQSLPLCKSLKKVTRHFRRKSIQIHTQQIHSDIIDHSHTLSCIGKPLLHGVDIDLQSIDLCYAALVSIF